MISYHIAAAIAAAAAASRYNGGLGTFVRNWRTWNFCQELYLGKSDLTNFTHAKKNRLEILYRTPYLKNQDLFSRTNFDTFLFSCNMCIF